MKEQELAKIFENSKIEVKYDKLASKTGNLFIEFECRGKKSGISTTQADWWCFAIGKPPITFHLIETEHLKRLCREVFKTGRIVNGGDDGVAKGVLLKVSKIF